ncbi:hypothetical protein [Algoriphagus sp.]|uniref:hypothetical protein n=1 Tax=Algoriphagus sp. TaxID=1872435 RepID=UPI00391BF0BA
METTELREELHNLIDKGEADLLKILLEVAKKLSSGDYSQPGNPMVREDLIARVQLAKARIDSGNFLTMEDLEEEIKKW